ncbi:MAG: hypothetical protein IT439_08360 [Phycisphaerales bacterium]|nr:hypothetical protein [Phycisphaerales bacterium]
MTSARFLIFGAHRDTGKPASLVLEAVSREEAEAFALQQGVLIHQVQELPSAAARLAAMAADPRPNDPPARGAHDAQTPARPPRRAEGPAEVPSARGESAGPVNEQAPRVAAESGAAQRRIAPEDDPARALSLRLPWPRGFDGLPGERVLATYEPRGLELGVLGALLGRRAKVVLTTQRFIVSQRRLFGGSIASARLGSLAGVTLGSRVSSWLMALGLGGLLLTIPLVAQAAGGAGLGGSLGGLTSDVDGAGGLLGPIQGLMDGAKQGMMAFVILQAVTSIAMVCFAWNKELAALGPGGPVALRGRLLNAKRASAIVAATEQAIHVIEVQRGHHA